MDSVLDTITTLPYLSGCNTRPHTVLQTAPDKTAGKLKNRNNLLMKPAGSSWGANTEPLLTLTSAMVLCYSVAEYWAQVWSWSSHTRLVDVQLNFTMRLNSGTLRSTLLPWILVLANIKPPALRRKAATDKLVEMITAHNNWAIHSDITNPPHACLPSRKPLWQPGRIWYVWTSEVNGKKSGSRLRWSTFP